MSIIDLSQLPPPAVVEMPKFQDLKAQRIAELQGLDPTFNALVESDPAIKLLEILVYREMVNVARTNSGVLAVLLAYARGADLDQLGANLDVFRLTITPADNTTIPPTPAVLESDEAFRQRIRLSWYARNTAGATQAYEYFALSADGTVADARAYGPHDSSDIPPGHVEVYVLSTEGDGTAPQSLLDLVADSLNDDFVRPLTDYVQVKAASLLNYQVTAKLIIGTGPDADTVKQASQRAMQIYADSTHKIGSPVSLAGVYRALKQAGVVDVVLTTPTATLTTGKGQAPFCTSITLTTEAAKGSDNDNE